MTKSLYQKKRRPSDLLLKIAINGAALLTVIVLAGIILYILINGLPYISWEFLSTSYSESPSGAKGILPMIINTLYIVAITLLIATPIGISSAIYLTQYAKQGRLVRAIRFTTEILSGIPSILFGLFGYTVFCVMFRMGTSILAGCLTMTLCILPTIVRTTEESLLAVPGSYKEGAMALGAGKLRVILGIVLPGNPHRRDSGHGPYRRGIGGAAVYLRHVLQYAQGFLRPDHEFRTNPDPAPVPDRYAGYL